MITTTTIRNYSLTNKEVNEINTFIEEIKPKGFKTCSELSEYIRENQNIQQKYPNITGILNMSMDENEWPYKGAISKKAYGIVKKELNLQDQSSRAIAGSFTPYANIINK